MISSGAISDTLGILPAMKITEPYSPTARAKASAKPVSSAGIRLGRITRRDGLPAVAPRLAAASSSSASSPQHRLHRAHHERQADEDQRHDDAQRRVGDLDAERRKRRAEPAVAGAYSVVSAMPATAVGRRTAGRPARRQPLAGKAIAHQHPGDDQAERPALTSAAAKRAGRRKAAGACSVARAGDDRQNCAEAELGGLEEQAPPAGSARSATARSA